LYDQQGMGRIHMRAPSAFQSVSAAALLWLFAGCVNLAPPWENQTSTGGSTGPGSGGVGDARGVVATGGTPGAGGDSAGTTGLGGVSGQYDAARDSAVDRTSAVDLNQGGMGSLDMGMDLPQPDSGGDAAKADPVPDGPAPGVDAIPAAQDTAMTDDTATVDVGVESDSRLGTDVGAVDSATGDGGVDIPPDASSLATGLLAYYPCESATGTKLPDMSNNGNDATLSATGSYSFGSGQIGRALTLLKSNSGYVSMPPAMFRGRSQITIAAWVKVVTAVNWQRVFDIGVNANLQSNPLNVTNTISYMNFVPQDYTGTEAALAITNTGCVNEQRLTTSALTAGSWKHVAIVLSGSAGTLYVDAGTPIVSTSMTLRPADLGTIDYAFIGRSQFSVDPYFDGAIDELRVYDRALSAEEVRALYSLTGP
jgi:hypothetical protein